MLHQRIEQRFHKMIELGFQEEVEKLYQREDLHPDLPSIRCVAIAKMWEYLRGDYVKIMKKWSSAVFVQLDN